MRPVSVLALMLLPLGATAGELKVEQAMVPLAPPTATVHAAYMTLTNDTDTVVQITGVRADGYAMAHLHESTISDGVASMRPIHMIEITPGQSVTLEHGGLHVMLMKPQEPVTQGAEVTLTLEMADGSTLPVTARVMSMKQIRAHGS